MVAKYLLVHRLPYSILDRGLGIEGRHPFILNAGFAVSIGIPNLHFLWLVLLCVLRGAKQSESGIVSSRHCSGSFCRKVRLPGGSS